MSWQSWWRHQMETFSVLLAICAGNSPVPGEFPSQRPVTQSFDVFFDLCLNKRLSKQSWGRWFETLSRPLWRQCNVNITDGNDIILTVMYIFKDYLLACLFLGRVWSSEATDINTLSSLDISHLHCHHHGGHSGSEQVLPWKSCIWKCLLQNVKHFVFATMC